MTYIEDLRKAVGQRPLLLAGTGLLATDPAGRILLQRRSDDGSWSLTGGYLGIGEIRLFGVFAGREFFHDYPDGRVYSVNLVYLSPDVTGSPRSDGSEVREARFFAADELPADLERATRQIMERYLQDLSAGQAAGAEA